MQVPVNEGDRNHKVTSLAIRSGHIWFSAYSETTATFPCATDLYFGGGHFRWIREKRFPSKRLGVSGKGAGLFVILMRSIRCSSFSKARWLQYRATVVANR
jgi:hypothetical protein